MHVKLTAQKYGLSEAMMTAIVEETLDEANEMLEICGVKARFCLDEGNKCLTIPSKEVLK